jgi:dihydrolipoamide dehydrogenase
MSDTENDVAILGAGPGRYVAAIRASQVGMKAAVIERGELGGVCLNVGCIPTNAVLHSADRLDEVKEDARIGVVASTITLDWDAVMDHKLRVVEQLRSGVAGLLRKHKIDVVWRLGTLHRSDV